MFSLFSKKLSDADKQVDDLVKKLGDALAVMSGIDEAQKRQIAELERALQHERDRIKRTETENMRRLKVENHKLEKEVERLRVKVGWIENRNIPQEFFEQIDRAELPVRVANALKNEGINHYVDLLDKPKGDFHRIPNFGASSFVGLVDHLQKKFPENWKHFVMFGEWEDKQ